MVDIIDLNEKRNEREQPDAEFVRKDDFGRPLYTFGVEYHMDGSTWSFHLWAYDFADAERRAAAIRETGKVFGQIMASVPA
jgi:hypothetical protein